jgi:hypothetical protein
MSKSDSIFSQNFRFLRESEDARPSPSAIGEATWKQGSTIFVSQKEKSTPSQCSRKNTASGAASRSPAAVSVRKPQASPLE